MISGPLYDQAPACGAILRSLPEWFGIQAEIDRYEADIARLPTFLAGGPQGVASPGVDAWDGFLSIKRHSPWAAEIYVMGVRRERQRRGVGRALVQAAEAWLRGQGVEYLQVKTLAPSDPDANYAATRAFYAAMGFRPLEELAGIWDPGNPCLLMIKRI